MKLLLFYVHTFSFKTAVKSLPEAPDLAREETVSNAVVAFFHVEAEDEERRAGVVEKFVKNTKWLCGKFGTKTAVLHSFNHLSLSKGSPELAQSVLEETTSRLSRAGYAVIVTPFGYFHEFSMHVAGDSLAKVFKEL